MTETINEVWETIPEFPTYSISNVGRVWNHKFDREMKINPNNFGLMKITLTDDETGERYDRSVAKLVAEAFVKKPNTRCDHVIFLDGDFSNLVHTNLAWRPRAFTWRYTHQLKEIDHQPNHYYNLEVQNLATGVIYENIIAAGKAEGLLFDDIWRSTYTKAPIFPNIHIFEVV